MRRHRGKRCGAPPAVPWRRWVHRDGAPRPPRGGGCCRGAAGVLRRGNGLLEVREVLRTEVFSSRSSEGTFTWETALLGAARDPTRREWAPGDLHWERSFTTRTALLRAAGGPSRTEWAPGAGRGPSHGDVLFLKHREVPHVDKRSSRRRERSFRWGMGSRSSGVPRVGRRSSAAPKAPRWAPPSQRRTQSGRRLSRRCAQQLSRGPLSPGCTEGV